MNDHIGNIEYEKVNKNCRFGEKNEARDAILEFEIAYDFVITNAQSKKKKNQDRMRIKS